MTKREISFDGHKVTIEFIHQEVCDLLVFLFDDLVEETDHESSATFLIEKDTENNKWRLTQDNKSLFNGENIAGLGVILMGEVLFHLICDNRKRLAIHAGLVSDDNNTILIPGTSGSGKTSMTTWLLANGMRYHTDELVSIDLESHLESHSGPCAVKAFTRPLNIKTNGVTAIESIIDLDAVRDQLRISHGVTMIPHRLVNPDFRTEFPDITRIIFPKYTADADAALVKLSGAEAGLEMMRSNVIARNLPAHGFNDIIKLVRHIPAWRVYYQHYDDLPALMARIY